jgi:ankyrin repeat protein
MSEIPDLNIADANKLTPLHCASWNGDAEAIRLLLKAGADNNAKTIYGQTPMDLAANDECRRVLTPLTTPEIPVIKTPTIPDSGDNFNETPLHIAVRNDNAETVRLLLANKVEVNVKDCFGWTPLHWAAATDSNVNIRRLISAGADVNIKDNGGWLPIDLTKNEECRRLLEAANIT